MLNCPMDILHQFPVRRTREQKKAFRDAVKAYAQSLGYPVSQEQGSFGSCNLVMGDPARATYLVTAHYDTCAAMLLPNLLTPMNPVLFFLYQVLLACITILPAALLGYAVSVAFIFWAAFHGWDPAAMTQLGIWAFLAVYLPLVAAALAALYFGPANRHNANDNTSGVVTLLEIARTMPHNQRHKVCFVLFDLEEKGLWGSRSYRKRHKAETDRQLVLNLDCVGDGDHIRMFPTGKLRKDPRKMTALYKACGYAGSKSLLLHEKRIGINPSDHKHFPWAVGICALKQKGRILYLSRIHTKKDTCLDQTNVNMLRSALTTFICLDEVYEERN